MSKDGGREKSKGLISKKQKKMLIKLALVSIVGGFGYILTKPEMVKDPGQRQKILDARETLTQLSSSVQEALQAGIPQTKTFTSNLDKITGSGVVLGDKEIYVEDLVKELTSSLEVLPAHQLQQFKQDFCADLVSNAVKDATASTNTE